MSSPGSGKTTLLERTIERLCGQAAVSVIEGDQETLRDAERIRGTGARAVQINTAAVVTSTPAWWRTRCALSIRREARCCSSRTSATSCAPRFSISERAQGVIASVTEGRTSR